MAAQAIEAPQRLARLAAFGVGDERNVVGVVGRDGDAAVGARLVLLLEVVGQAVELGRVDRQRAHVVFDVLAELLADLEQLLAQLAHARARRVVLVDAGAAQIAQRLVHVIFRGGVGRIDVDGGERVEHATVERQLGGERVDFLLALIGGVAHLRIGVRVAADAGACGGVAERPHRFVVRLQRGVGGARRRHTVEHRDALLGALHVGAAGGEERLRSSGEDARGVRRWKRHPRNISYSPGDAERAKRATSIVVFARPVGPCCSRAKLVNVDNVRAQFPGLATDWILLDNAGGSQMLGGAIDRVVEFYHTSNVQLGGTYAPSQLAAERVTSGHAALARWIHCGADELVLGTSTTQLLNNLALAMSAQIAPGDEIIVTDVDHESNIGCWRRLAAARGAIVKEWRVDGESLALRVEDLEPLLTDKTRLVCFTQASNLVGTVHDAGAITRFVHAARRPRLRRRRRLRAASSGRRARLGRRLLRLQRLQDSTVHTWRACTASASTWPRSPASTTSSSRTRPTSCSRATRPTSSSARSGPSSIISSRSTSPTSRRTSALWPRACSIFSTE